MKSNIVLIGMPGSGKSTCGVVLAKTLGYSFVDTDLLICRRTGKKLQQILDTDGVDVFLENENAVGESLECESTVVATGGSMVKCEKAIQHLGKIGTLVYLNVPLNVLKKRIKNFSTRGIVFINGESFEDLYNDRTKLYEKYADITIDFADNNIESTIDRIVEALNKLN